MSDWVLLGLACSDSGDVEVWQRGDGTISIEQPDHEDCAALLIPAERDKLRELLDRAAMPGRVNP